MKRKVLKWTMMPALVLVVLLMTRCKDGGKVAGFNEKDSVEVGAEAEMDDKDSVEVEAKAEMDEIVFTSLKCNIENKYCAVDYTVSYPVSGSNRVMVDRTREWINEMLWYMCSEVIDKGLGQRYNGDLADGQALVDHYAKEARDIFCSGECKEEVDEYGWVLLNSISVIYKCDRYVTMMSDYHHLPAGSVDGGTPGSMGVTVCCDGRRITWGMFENSRSSAFQKILRKEAIDNIEEMFCFENNEKIPLPKCPPLLTAEGVMFIYQPGEGIAECIPPHRTVQFTVPYDRMKAVMSPRLISFLGLDSEKFNVRHLIQRK